MCEHQGASLWLANPRQALDALAPSPRSPSWRCCILVGSLSAGLAALLAASPCCAPHRALRFRRSSGLSSLGLASQAHEEVRARRTRHLPPRSAPQTARSRPAAHCRQPELDPSGGGGPSAGIYPGPECRLNLRRSAPTRLGPSRCAHNGRRKRCPACDGGAHDAPERRGAPTQAETPQPSASRPTHRQNPST